MKSQSSQSVLVNVDGTSLEALSSIYSKSITFKTRRTQFIIQNTGATTITLTKGMQTAVAGTGIQLYPSGGYSESTDSGFTCWQGAIQAIGSGAGGTISITESWEDD